VLGASTHSPVRLDGSEQLRRSRFLHIDVDLEYRSEAIEIEPGTPAGPELVTTARPDPVAGAPPEPYRVHHLRQSRQVKSNEIHYFDSAYLGALVRVTPIEES
jgi:hypothetical protein